MAGFGATPPLARASAKHGCPCFADLRHHDLRPDEPPEDQLDGGEGNEGSDGARSRPLALIRAEGAGLEGVGEGTNAIPAAIVTCRDKYERAEQQVAISHYLLPWFDSILTDIPPILCGRLFRFALSGVSTTVNRASRCSRRSKAAGDCGEAVNALIQPARGAD
jgi:hypothetical protein